MYIDSYVSYNLPILMRLTNDQINQDLEELSSGNLINYASDNPSGLQLLTRFNSMIDGNNTSNDNIDQGLSLVNSASSVMSQIQNTLSSIRDLIVTNSDNTLSTDQKASNQSLIASKLDDIDNLINSTYYNGIQVINSGDTVLSNTFASSNTGVANTNTLYLNTNWSHNLTVNQLAQAKQVSSDAQTSSSTALGLSGSFSLNGTTLNATTNMSLTDISNLINSSNAGVISSISNNKLILTSSATGSSSTIAASDLSGTTNSSSSDTTVADVASVLNQTNWSHNVSVTQIATGSYQDGYFISGSDLFSNHVSDLTNGGITLTSADGTKSFAETFASAGVTASDDMSTALNKLANAINSNPNNYGISAAFNSDPTLGVSLNLTNYTTGASSDFTISGDSSFLSYSGLSDPNQHLAGQDSNYSVDGSNYTNSSNTVTIGTGSSNDAQITLNGFGTTTVSNESDVLQYLGLLNADSTFKNITQNGQDANYSVDGENYTSSTNSDVIVENGGKIYSSADLTGIGTTTISNSTTTSPSSSPTTIQLHTGWSVNNIYDITLSQISTALLGISSLRTDTTNGLHLIDSAIDQVSMEQSRLGGLTDSLNNYKTLNTNTNTAFTTVTSQLNDVDSAKVQSEIAKLQIQQVGS